MASGHLLLSCAKRAATTKIDLFAYLWQLPCALCSLILMTLIIQVNSSKSRFAKKYLSVFSERFVASKCDTNLSEKTLAKVCACLQFFLCLAIWLPIIEVKLDSLF